MGNTTSNDQSDRAYWLFNGDLLTLATIQEKLRNTGKFEYLTRSNVYPGFTKDRFENYKRALKYLFERRITGWTSQEYDLVQYGICTQTEFDEAIGRTSPQNSQ